jgi:hypothetical protein
MVRTESWPVCSRYDDVGPANGSWLIPEIAHTPLSVTITLHESDSFDTAKCGRQHAFYDLWGIPPEFT